MKLIKTILVLIILLFASSGYCIETMNQSADFTADASAITGRGNFYGIWIVTDGANSVTFDIYDNTAASGTKIIPTTVIDPTDGVAQKISFSPPVEFKTGIYVDITTAGTVTFKVYSSDVF